MKSHRPRSPVSGSPARPPSRDSRPRSSHDPRRGRGPQRPGHIYERKGNEMPKAPKLGLTVPEQRPEFCAHEDSDVVQTRALYTVELKGTEVYIFDKDGTQVTRIWGDPHVEEADGETNWHFGEDSTFILPDGTKICLNTEPNDAGEWFVVGADIISGNSRYHWGEEGEAGLSKDGKKWDAENADCSEDASAGVFALQSTGEWAVMGDDGQFYDITEESWSDYLSDRDIDYDPSNLAVGITPTQLSSAHAETGHMGPPIPGLDPEIQALIAKRAGELIPLFLQNPHLAGFVSELSPRLLERYLERPELIRDMATRGPAQMFPGAPAWWGQESDRP